MVRGGGGGSTHEKDSTLPLPESLFNFEDSYVSVRIVCLLQRLNSSQGKVTGKACFSFYLSCMTAEFYLNSAI